MNNVLEIKNATLDLRGGEWAIRLPDVFVPRGKYISIPGSDSGFATALLQLLTQGATVASGSIELLGTPLQVASRRTLLRLRRSIAFLSPTLGIIADWTVQDNVALPLSVRGHISKSRRKGIHAALSQLELIGVAKSTVGQLTPSQKLLVSLAQAIVKVPKFIMTEKCWGDDINDRVEMILRDFVRNGSTVMVEGAESVEQSHPEAILP